MFLSDLDIIVLTLFNASSTFVYIRPNTRYEYLAEIL
jgi:hypothetical protein